MKKHTIIFTLALVCISIPVFADGPQPDAVFDSLISIYGNEGKRTFVEAHVIQELCCEQYGGNGPARTAFDAWGSNYKIIAVGDSYEMDAVKIAVYDKNDNVIASNDTAAKVATLTFKGANEPVVIEISGSDDGYYGAAGFIVFWAE